MKTLIAIGVALFWLAGGKAQAQGEKGTPGKKEGLEKSGAGVVAGDEEKLRTAVVNIQELFRQYHKVEKAEEEINMERSRIQKEDNDLAGRLRSMDQRLRELEVRLQAPDLPDRVRGSLEREKGVRFQERELLRHQKKAGLVARHTELNRKMVARMDLLLLEIRDLVAEQAEKEGYDLVFDLEGTNSAQVPVLLFAKDAVDITPLVLEKLNGRSSSGG
ncbi:MAG: hypothetical protein CMO40_02715 [Verrucomicrobiaceae bacterium]|nr:hypothetical protein [Verrucomicrobiaceae bacterium]